MKLADALKRIEALEAKVRALEAAPKQEIHYHTHQPQYSPPTWPAIPPVWCGAGDPIHN